MKSVSGRGIRGLNDNEEKYNKIFLVKSVSDRH